MPVIWMLRVAAAVVVVAVSSAQVNPPSEDWRFALGARGESLHVVAHDMPRSDTIVALPHRAVRPNTSMWYARTIDLPAEASIAVDADDGAQVFVDGVQWVNDRRVFSPPTSVPPGPHAVIVRVLNNAMHGGLRRVSVSSGRVAPALMPLAAVPPGFDAPDSASFQQRMPGPSAACDFTLWADSQGGWDTFAALVARMAERPHHFSAGVGDLVNDGSDPGAWVSFLSAMAPLAARVPVVPVVGNHDYDGFYNTLVSRWYSQLFRRDATWMAWSCGPARFVAVDVNREFPIGVSAGSAQDAWLKREVASTAWREARWRVLLVHQSPFSLSWQGYDGDEAVRALVHDLVERHGLHVVVSGHSHAYEHLVRDVAGRPLHVLITGGAGGGLEPPMRSPVPAPDRVVVEHHFVRAQATATDVSVEAVNRDGRVLDRWRVSRSSFGRD